MARITVEHAWVEFPVALPPGRGGLSARTGGTIDAARGVVTALRDISFEIREGDRLGLMGHNGAGKTTLLRLLAGAYPPTRGRILSSGRISTLFNTLPGLATDGTGRENIMTCALHLGLSRREILRKMDDIIDFAELGDFIDLPVRIYSAGMLTRLGFSIATAVEPEILLLDEGLATGDASFAQKAERRMNELIARASIFVVASHSDTLLASLCNRALLLEHGQVVREGAADRIYSSYIEGVVQAARADDEAAQARAYALANELSSQGLRVPDDLQEQALRHAIRINPTNVSLLQSYVTLVQSKGRLLPAYEEARLMMTLIGIYPDRAAYRARLAELMPAAEPRLDPDERSAAARLIAG
jgi:lipopolysaccharide transport system ATP-binding protein